MKKRIFLALLVVTLAAGGAFAQVSFGIGGFVGGDFGGGVEMSASAGGITAKGGIKMPYFGGGGYVFLDAQFVELTFGLYGGKMDYKGYTEVNGTYNETNAVTFSISNFNIGLFGKIPTDLGALTVFPMLGIDYAMTTALKDENGNEANDAGDLSALWIKAGGGLDLGLGGNLFLRAEALYGIRFANKIENDLKDGMTVPGADTRTRLGHGLDIKLAIGFRL